MTETIITALITGGFALIGVIVTSTVTSREMNAKLDKQLAITETKLDALREEVQKHNNFGQRIPVVEEQIKSIHHRIEDLEHIKLHEN